jgi:hypothetical protein
VIRVPVYIQRELNSNRAEVMETEGVSKQLMDHTHRGKSQVGSPTSCRKSQTKIEVLIPLLITKN